MEKNPLEQQQAKINALREELRGKIITLFESKKKLAPLMEQFILQLNSFEGTGLIFDKEKMTEDVRAGAAIKDKDAFVAHYVKILEPFTIFRVTHAKVFEDKERENIFKNEGNLKLSEVLYTRLDDDDEEENSSGILEYFTSSVKFIKENVKKINKEDAETILIHLPPAKEFIKAEGMAKFKEEIVKGLIELAKVIKLHPEIKKIYSISWIVAKNPILLERLGFTIEGQISEDEKKKHFTEETRPVAKAFMTSEDFLNRYGNTNN